MREVTVNNFIYLLFSRSKLLPLEGYHESAIDRIF